ARSRKAARRAAGATNPSGSSRDSKARSASGARTRSARSSQARSRTTTRRSPRSPGTVSCPRAAPSSRPPPARLPIVIADIWLLLLPIWILLGLLLLLGIVFVLARVRGGKYVRPLFVALAKVPLIGKLLTRASEAAMERSNPELASALKKMKRYGGATTDPLKAQQA